MKSDSRRALPVAVGNARFTVVAPGCIRMEYAPNGTFIDEPSWFAVNRKASCKEWTHARAGNETVIETERIVLRYSPDGKAFHKGNLKATIKTREGDVEWFPEKKNLRNLGGTLSSLDRVTDPVDLGEGILSRDGWYLFDDSRSILLTNGWISPRPADSGTDWYLFGYGHDYKSALKAMGEIAGCVPLPRKCLLGSWYSRYWPYTSKEYKTIVKEFAAHDFPLDVMVMDMDWHKDGWTGWSWNRKLLPDAEALVKWLHEQRLAVTLNVHPEGGAEPHEDNYASFMRALGRDPARGENVPFDAGDKKYLDAWFACLHAPLEKDGVDFWWLDCRSDLRTRSIDELTNVAALNRLYFAHTNQGKKRGASFSRWGGWGDHRNPIHFSGDAHTYWRTLAFEVPFNATAGNVGCFFWSHDIGGHMGPRLDETYTRWAQFGSATAALRIHSSRSDDLDRRPWEWSKQAEKSIRSSFHLRSRLFPYIYSSAWQCHCEMLPLSRPMYLEYPDKENAYHNPQQYLFGDSLLAAPVTSPGAGPDKLASQVVWFPEGTWYNWFTGEKYTVEREVIVSADINEFPLYARAGVPIPLQPYTQRMASEPLNELIVCCYPGTDGKTESCTLYEDDGISKDYLDGKYALTPLQYSRAGKEVTVTIGPTSGNYNGLPARRSYTIELPCTLNADAARMDGKTVDVAYDRAARMNRIHIPERSVTNGVTVVVTVSESNPAAARADALKRRLAGLLGSAGRTQSWHDAMKKYAGAKADPGIRKALLALGGMGVHIRNGCTLTRDGVKMPCVFCGADDTRPENIRMTIVDRSKYTGEKIIVDNQPLEVTELFPTLIPVEKWALANDSLGDTLERLLQVDFGEYGSVSMMVSKKESYLSKWKTVGPFPFDGRSNIAEQVHAPELGAVDLGTGYVGSEGQKVTWADIDVENEGVVDLRKRYDFNNRIAYAISYLDSDTTQKATLHISSDDGVEAWVNGKKVHSNHVFRGGLNEVDVVPVTMKKGRNVILLKIFNGEGDWRFRAAVESDHPLRQCTPNP